LKLSKQEKEFECLRHHMVETQIKRRGIVLPAVLAAMQTVPRHNFIPEKIRSHAYDDAALPLVEGQTISQPYIVGLMTELCAPQPGKTVLEIGTGSGYQAAVLAETGMTVATLEMHASLAQQAMQTLDALGYSQNVISKLGDGFSGWSEQAPFDCILITCAVSHIPPPLVQQLKPNGKLIVPLGEQLNHQTLTVITKLVNNDLIFKKILGVVFVPMTGPHGFDPSS